MFPSKIIHEYYDYIIKLHLRAILIFVICI
ncbi:hypothetical protein AGR4A_Lc10170 [Agrobacterium tumefaciens str. B6]|uniref:Uncharacterized protein n=1 Tax=Agrobacterium tumefaciens str. B6 TaxID=1183423 RepID=A0A822V2M2_AGRTU|nr:hypothetical protein AGR4A_Lc10170 [Agrobacterium tumefaciens str. B6]